MDTQKRKIIQLLRCPANKVRGDKFDAVYALCDDGTLFWRNIGCANEHWVLEEPVPQGSDLSAYEPIQPVPGLR